MSQERLAGLYEGELESYEQLSERLTKWVFEGFRVQAKTRFHSDFRDIALREVIRREEFLAIRLAFDCAGEPSEDYLPAFDFFEVVELKPLDLTYVEKRERKRKTVQDHREPSKG
jgi:hypothetical protein